MKALDVQEAISHIVAMRGRQGEFSAYGCRRTTFTESGEVSEIDVSVAEGGVILRIVFYGGRCGGRCEWRRRRRVQEHVLVLHAPSARVLPDGVVIEAKEGTLVLGFEEGKALLETVH